MIVIVRPLQASWFVPESSIRTCVGPAVTVVPWVTFVLNVIGSTTNHEPRQLPLSATAPLIVPTYWLPEPGFWTLTETGTSAPPG